MPLQIAIQSLGIALIGIGAFGMARLHFRYPTPRHEDGEGLRGRRTGR